MNLFAHASLILLYLCHVQTGFIKRQRPANQLHSHTNIQRLVAKRDHKNNTQEIQRIHKASATLSVRCPGTKRSKNCSRVKKGANRKSAILAHKKNSGDGKRYWDPFKRIGLCCARELYKDERITWQKKSFRKLLNLAINSIDTPQRKWNWHMVYLSLKSTYIHRKAI